MMSSRFKEVTDGKIDIPHRHEQNLSSLTKMEGNLYSQDEVV